MLDEVDDAAVVLEGRACVSASGRSSTKRISRPLLRNAMICSRSRTVWARNSISSKIDGVGPEGHGGAGAPPGRRAGDLELAHRLAAVLELQDVVLAVAVDLEDQPGRQGVDDRDADAVETARDLVALAAELAAGVQHGEHDLGRRLSLGYFGWGRRGCPAPLSATRHAAVGQQGDVDLGGSSRPWPRRPSCRRPPRPGGAARSGPVEPMYMPGRFRTGSRPSRTVMSSALYVVRSSLPSSSFFSATGAPFPTSSDWSGTSGTQSSAVRRGRSGDGGDPPIPRSQCSPQV